MDKSQTTQEVEESKGSPVSHVVNPYTLKKLANPLPPKRCVIIVPPLYLEHDIQSKLVEKNEGKDLEYEWNETAKISQEENVIVICKFPRIKDKSLVGGSTFFLIAGFDEETKIATLKKLETVTETKDNSQYRKQETTFIASRDKQKTLDTLWSNAKSFIETMAKELPNNYCELHLSKAEDIVDKIDFAFEKLGEVQTALTVEQINAIKVALDKSETTERKKALFLIPIGMAGMGKTTFLNILRKNLEEKGSAVTVISSDKIRKQHIEDAMQEDLDIDEDNAFNKVGSDARYQFFGDIINALKKTDTLSQNTHVILLDKNHVPQIIPRTLELVVQLKSRAKSKCMVKTVIINPLCTYGFQTQTSTFPFSLTFFLTCLHRAAGRKDHETLKGTNIKATKVVLEFFKAYKDYKATEAGLKALKANFLLEVPFTHEDVEAEKNLPETLVASFNAMLDADEELLEEKIVAFLNEVEKIKFEPKNPDLAMISEGVVDGLSKPFSLFCVKREVINGELVL